MIEIMETKPLVTFDFGTAIEFLKMGRRVARLGWNGRGIFLELQRPDEHSKMTHPYIFIDTTGLQTDNQHAPKSRVPWLASQTDMLAEDFVLVDQVVEECGACKLKNKKSSLCGQCNFAGGNPKCNN